METLAHDFAHAATRIFLTVTATLVDAVTILTVGLAVFMAGGFTLTNGLGVEPGFLYFLGLVGIGSVAVLCGFASPLITHRMVRWIDQYSLYQ